MPLEPYLFAPRSHAKKERVSSYANPFDIFETYTENLSPLYTETVIALIPSSIAAGVASPSGTAHAASRSSGSGAHRSRSGSSTH